MTQPLVVDAHTHVFPPEIVENREAWQARDAWFSLLYQNPKARLIAADDLIASMDQAGIERSVLCGFPWRDSGLCDEHNAYMLDAVRRFPDRLTWLAIVSPAHGRALSSRTEDLIGSGAAGLGELNADAQGFELSALEAIRPALVMCQDLAKPVLFHASEPVGHDYPGKGTATPARLVKLADAFPRLAIVLAHWGGGLPFYELMPEVRAALANVCYDSAASTYLYDFGVFRQVIDLVGASKVLFGSDYPVLRQDRFLERARSVAWRDDEERDAVLGGTATRVYGILNTGGEAA
ncbi:MAG: amidohydrolase family protein [Thermomicrobiales bacterium]